MVNKVITFYSYKGGVGRSMAMANIAVMLAQWGYKTLIIDWDLEAPGLENFYCNYLNTESVIKKAGMIDLLNLKETNPDVKVEDIPWEDYTTHIRINKDITLDLISAGRRDESYIKHIKQFDFTNFYQNADGGQYLEDLREYWLDQYNFILIDSRTGLTDSSGICSIHMPDILVLLFTPNEQSFNGIKSVAKRAIDGQKQIIFDRFKLRTLPVPSRIEFQETTLLDEWMTRIYNESGEMLEWLPKKKDNITEHLITPGQLINQIKIPYRTFYAYGEKLAVMERGTHDPQDIGYSYETIAAVLANDFQDINLLIDSRDSYIKKAKGEDYTDDSNFKYKIEKEQQAKKELENQLVAKDKEMEDQLLAREKQARKKNIYVGIFMLLILAAILLVFLLPAKKKPDTGEIPAYTDSLSNKEAYLKFKSDYLNLDSNRFEINSNLALIKSYYLLSKAYQDSAADIKTQLENVITDEATAFLKRYYTALHGTSFNAREFFADSITVFGSLTNITPALIQRKTDSIKLSKKNIQNDFSESTEIKFKSDSAGLYISYVEKGNFLLDTRQEYKDMETAVTASISYDLKITAFNYTVIKGNIVSNAIQKVVLEIFFCSAKDKTQIRSENDIVSQLEKTNRYTVYPRSNFSIPPDTSSPYYIRSNEIRYNGSEEMAMAKEIQNIINKTAAISTDLRPTRTPTKNYLSIFICFGKTLVRPKPADATPVQYKKS